jgi:hypothetical protein
MMNAAFWKRGIGMGSAAMAYWNASTALGAKLATSWARIETKTLRILSVSVPDAIFDERWRMKAQVWSPTGRK